VSVITPHAGIALHSRITEVTETYEAGNIRLDITFGAAIPRPAEIIKRALDQPIAEGGAKGEPGEPGEPGPPGVGLEYDWDGTKLGIKREDEPSYTYVDLQGPQGPKGDKGDQ